MLEVNTAEYAGGYNIHLVFNNGRAGTANLERTVFSDTRPVFTKLREKSTFENFKVKHSTVVWSEELDLASEYLFFLVFRDDPDLQEKFKAWGYIA